MALSRPLSKLRGHPLPQAGEGFQIPGQAKTAPFLPAPNTWCNLPATALRRRVRGAPGTAREGRAAPRRVSPEEIRLGLPRRGPPIRHYERVARCCWAACPEEPNRKGRPRRKEERTSRGCKTPCGALRRRHQNTELRRRFSAPLPCSLTHPSHPAAGAIKRARRPAARRVRQGPHAPCPRVLRDRHGSPHPENAALCRP